MFGVNGAKHDISITGPAMARRKKTKGPSIRSYFIKLFTDHPDWLGLSTNTGALEQWKSDHNATEVPPNVKQGLASVKSYLRRQGKPGARKPGWKGGRPAKTLAPAAAVPEIELLETRIDECVSMARGLDVTRLEPVIKHLRIALAHIVLMFDNQS
jgi:hypothetical protein